MILDDERLRAALCAADAAMLAALPRESELSHTFSPRFLRKMRPLLRQQYRPQVVRTILAVARQAAVLALVSITVMLATLMSVEATRARAVEIAVQVLERYTSITVQWDPARSNEAFVPVLPTYIPQGMELYEEENGASDVVRRYINSNGDVLWYRQFTLGASTTLLDTEDTTVYSKMIAGQEVAYYMNKGYNQMYWYDDKNMYILFTSLDERTMFAIAKSVIIQEK